MVWSASNCTGTDFNWTVGYLVCPAQEPVYLDSAKHPGRLFLVIIISYPLYFFTENFLSFFNICELKIITAST
jgi:hypothetical protein